MDLISHKMWTDPRTGCSRMVSPETEYFLRLAADVVRAVGQWRDSNGAFLLAKRQRDYPVLNDTQLNEMWGGVSTNY